MVNVTPKMGGRARLRLYIHAQSDTTPSLLGAPGQAALPGLAALVQAKYGERFQLELIAEPGAPVAVMRQPGLVPGPAADSLPPAQPVFNAPLASQLWQAAPDIVILSLLPDLCYPLWQNSRTGRLMALPPDETEALSAAHAQILREQYSEVGLSAAAQYQSALIELIQVIKARLDAHILVYNASSIVPGDKTHRYYQQPDTLALRIHRFNLALIDVSVAEGISIIDADRLVADAGGAQQVQSALNYGPAAHQAIAYEVLRVLEDIGFFEERPLLSQVGQGKI